MKKVVRNATLYNLQYLCMRYNFPVKYGLDLRADLHCSMIDLPNQHLIDRWRTSHINVIAMRVFQRKFFYPLHSFSNSAVFIQFEFNINEKGIVTGRLKQSRSNALTYL